MMLLPSILAVSGLNISVIEKKRAEENFISSFGAIPLVTVCDDSYENYSLISEKDRFYSNSLDVSKRLVDNIKGLYKRNSISLNVAKKAIETILDISPSNLNFLDESDIYVTDNKTLVLDFYYNDDDYFSLEIGKDDIGFFSESNGEIIDYCESLNNEGNLNLNKIMSQFQSTINI